MQRSGNAIYHKHDTDSFLITVGREEGKPTEKFFFISFETHNVNQVEEAVMFVVVCYFMHLPIV